MTRTQKLVQAAKQAKEQAKPGINGRSAAKIKVTSSGTPPSSGTEAFARLLAAAMLNQS